MTDSNEMRLGYTDGDVDTNNSDNPWLNELIEQRYSRRTTMRSGAAAIATAALGGAALAGCDEVVGDDFDPGAAPTVTAGSSGATTSGRMVTLTGTTDAEGFTWLQISGPTVTTSNPDAKVVTFIAPTVSAATNLVFRFVVNRNGLTSSQETTVTVSPAVLGFTSIAKNRNDVVTVPTGYSVQVVNRLGDPIHAGWPAYKNDGTDTDFSVRIGDHGDALYWYGLNASGARDDNSSTRGLMVQNHENLNIQYLHPAGPTNVSTGPRPEAEAIKEIEAHGVAVTELREGPGRVWSMVQTSAFNRRITPNTPVTFAGPVAGHALMKTAYSPAGNTGRGTINNCANGHTLWGTNLTCEENWAGYFRRQAGDNANRTPREITQLNRYGITQGAGGSYAWATVTPSNPSDTSFRRWNVTVDTAQPADGTGDFRNEANHFGWVVEIDPYDKSIAPRKRTALGRLGHEGAWYGRFIAGRKLAVYLGDDARGEYFYKFVTTQNWTASDATAANRMAIGDKYLNSGTLYVARFNPDGSGTWIPLTFGSVPDRPAMGGDPVYVFADQNDILLHTRLAADAVGATRMDRPEWTATSWANGDIYLTLTNNNATLRPLTGTDAANPRHYNDPRGTPPTNQFGNPNGHILRLREAQVGGQEDPAATTFTWDIYLFGADSADSNSDVNISGLTASNDFSSPDGLWFSRPQNPAGQGTRPVLWIQTDDGAFTDRTNNQMLAAMPGPTGDGGARTITNVGAGGATAVQTTRVGAPATDATLKRFLVGPIDCEITGVDTTPDGRTLFVGIQHPGEGGSAAAPNSHWPDSQATGTAGATVRPRSAIAVITKDDGGVVAL